MNHEITLEEIKRVSNLLPHSYRKIMNELYRNLTGEPAIAGDQFLSLYIFTAGFIIGLESSSAIDVLAPFKFCNNEQKGR